MSNKNIQIFRIIDQKFGPGYVEYTLHKPINYLDGEDNRVLISNQPPFSHYRVGDYLGINTEIVRGRTSSVQKTIFSDRKIVSKVLCKPPLFYTKEVFNSEEFGDGWVREGE